MTTPQPEMLPEHPAMFAALEVPNFRRYVSGQSLSLIGTWVETVAQALLVLRLTHSGTVLGLTTAARYAPVLLLSPYTGLLVDRYAKRHVLLGTQAGLGLVSAALGAAVLAGEIRLWQAFTQEVVGHDMVRNAVTLNSTSVNVARVIGPTIAAILVSTVGIGWCFVVNAASFGFVIVSLLSLGNGTTYSWLIGALGAGAVVGGLYAARSARTGVARLIRAAIGSASPASLAYPLMTLSALALGLQANSIRELNVPGISTTAFTATFIGL